MVIQLNALIISFCTRIFQRVIRLLQDQITTSTEWMQTPTSLLLYGEVTYSKLKVAKHNLHVSQEVN